MTYAFKLGALYLFIKNESETKKPETLSVTPVFLQKSDYSCGKALSVQLVISRARRIT